jgi:hypothetical protein
MCLICGEVYNRMICSKCPECALQKQQRKKKQKLHSSPSSSSSSSSSSSLSDDEVPDECHWCDEKDTKLRQCPNCDEYTCNGCMSKCDAAACKREYCKGCKSEYGTCDSVTDQHKEESKEYDDLSEYKICPCDESGGGNELCRMQVLAQYYTSSIVTWKKKKE